MVGSRDECERKEGRGGRGREIQAKQGERKKEICQRSAKEKGSGRWKEQKKGCSLGEADDYFH